MKNEKLLKVLIYITGIICLYAFIAIRSQPLYNTLLKEKMVTGYWDKTKYGELYYFSCIKYFRENGLPPAQEKFQFTSKQASLNDADIIVFGDSFFDISRHPQFPQKLADTLKANVHFFKGDFPLAYFAENNYAGNEPKVLFYERVERFIPFAFENALYDEYQIDKRSNFREKTGKIKDLIFYQRSEELFDALIKKSYFTSTIYSTISTVKFDLFDYISPLTPVYSKDKKDPWIFYHDQTNGQKSSFYYQHSEDEMNNICQNMSDLSKVLKEKYNIRLIYLPLPAKYTLYHKFLNNDEYNNFLNKLYKGLRERNVEFIEVFDDLKNSNEILYYRTDDHWNEKGVQIAFNKTIEYFKKDTTLNEFFK